jgi:hypothetical protein
MSLEAEEAWDRCEAEWFARVDAKVERIKALGLVLVVRGEVTRRQRALASADRDLRAALERTTAARVDLDAGVSFLEDCMRLASRTE